MTRNYRGQAAITPARSDTTAIPELVQYWPPMVKVVRHRTALVRQVHLAQQSPEARIFSQRAPTAPNFEPREAGVSLLIGALSPLECLVLLAAPGIHTGDRQRRVFSILGDQPCQNALRRINMPQRVFRLGLARQTEGWQCCLTKEGQCPFGMMVQELQRPQVGTCTIRVRSYHKCLLIKWATLRQLLIGNEEESKAHAKLCGQRIERESLLLSGNSLGQLA